jgi:hypothetical protein
MFQQSIDLAESSPARSVTNSPLNSPLSCVAYPIQFLSACSSPASYLHTPALYVSSASPTPPQALTVSDNDRLRNTPLITKHTINQLRSRNSQLLSPIPPSGLDSTIPDLPSVHANACKPTSCLSRTSYTKFFADRAHPGAFSRRRYAMPLNSRLPLPLRFKRSPYHKRHRSVQRPKFTTQFDTPHA